MRRLVIIGNGMAATRLAEKLAARAQGRFIITLIGDEPQPAYNRIQLSPVLGGEKRRRKSNCCRRSGTPSMVSACGLARRSAKWMSRGGGCASAATGWNGMNWCSPPGRSRLSRRCRVLSARRYSPFAPRRMLKTSGSPRPGGGNRRWRIGRGGRGGAAPSRWGSDATHRGSGLMEPLTDALPRNS